MFLDNLLSMFLGVTAVTKEKVEDLTEFLVEKGDMQREEAREVASRILEKGKEEREEYISRLQHKFESYKERLVTKGDLERLEAKIDELLQYYQNREDQ